MEGDVRTPGRQDAAMDSAARARKGRRVRPDARGQDWSWAAVLGVVLLLVAAYGTWGLSIFLWPVTLGLSVVAWFRSDRDGLF